MAKEIILDSPIKVLKTKDVPALADLTEGQVAIGNRGDKPTIHGRIGDEVVNLVPETTKESVGLGNVTNDAQVKRSEMGKPNGVATLNDTGKVPSEQLPSYVDDAVEVTAIDAWNSSAGKPMSDGVKTYEDGDVLAIAVSDSSGFDQFGLYTYRETGWVKTADFEKGKIYVSTSKNTWNDTQVSGNTYVWDANTTWRWSGQTLIRIGGQDTAELEASLTELSSWKEKFTKPMNKKVYVLNEISPAIRYSDLVTFNVYKSTYEGGADSNAIAIDSATNEKAGVMSAADKTALEELKGISVTLRVVEI